jgi:hypothetical protein
VATPRSKVAELSLVDARGKHHAPPKGTDLPLLHVQGDRLGLQVRLSSALAGDGEHSLGDTDVDGRARDPASSMVMTSSAPSDEDGFLDNGVHRQTVQT